MVEHNNAKIISPFKNYMLQYYYNEKRKKKLNGKGTSKEGVQWRFT